MINYGSKIFTKPDIKRKEKSSLLPMIYAQALDTIFIAMKGQRIFERFEFNLPKSEKPQLESKLVFEFDSWEYEFNFNDWVNTSTDECMTGYLALVELSYLLEEAANRELF